MGSCPGTAADGLLVNLGTNNDVTITSGTITVDSLQLLIAGDADIGNVDLELAWTAVSDPNRLPTCLSDGVSACITITANPEDDDAFTYTTTKVSPAGCVAESTSDTSADGTVVAPNCTLERSIRVTPRAFATGGATAVVVVSNSAAADDTAAFAFLRCENDTAGNTTTGSETAANKPNVEIPGNTAGAGFAINFGPVGVSYNTALTCWVVTEEASTGTTDVGTDNVRVFWVRTQS